MVFVRMVGGALSVMDSISKLTPSISFSDIGDTVSHFSDTVSHLPFDRVIDVIESVTPDLSDVADTAAAVARSGQRVGTRTVRTTYRMIRSNPETVAGIIAGLIAATAVVMFIKKRRAKQADVHLTAAT